LPRFVAAVGGFEANLFDRFGTDGHEAGFRGQESGYAEQRQSKRIV
jgi:hypothetical protein